VYIAQICSNGFVITKGICACRLSQEFKWNVSSGIPSTCVQITEVTQCPGLSFHMLTPNAIAYLWALWKNIRKQVGCHRWRRVPHWFAGQAAGFTAFRFRFNHISLISMICIDMQHMVSCWPWPELAPGHSPIRLVTFGFNGYILTDWGVQLTMCACYYSPETDKTIFATEWRCIVRKDLDVFAEWADSLVLCSVDSDVLLQLGGSSHLVTRVIHPIYNWVIRCYKML
jgi:hypothetical protein